MESIIRDDGYINATLLCKKGNKKFNDWFRNRSSKNYIKILSNKLNMSEENILSIKTGKYGGSWIHPLLANNLAQWISADFAVDVSLWIEEWKTIKNNQEIYKNKISNLISDDDYYSKEQEIVKQLQEKIGGQKEVETKVGYIDLLTDTQLIEVKNGKNWKHAVGQVLMYGIEYPNYEKVICLFDIENNEVINNYCKKYNIQVLYYDDE
jgi:hypothetical protein